mgnify:CR=1 FL=1|jgi:hypothetical protein
MTDTEINLTLTIDETNLILEALGNLPFSKVFTLISKIQEQASQQISPEVAATEDSDNNQDHA